MLPNDTILGVLSIVEVYETHDIPRLFLAENNLGQQFIVLWVDFDAETETWLYLPVSAARLRLIRTGEIDLRDTFRDSEVGMVWEAIATMGDGQWALSFVPSGKLEDARLPDAGQRLKMPDSAPKNARASSIDELAIGGKRDALAIALFYAKNYGYRAPAREVGRFMGALQDSLDAFAAKHRGRFGPGGSVPADIMDATQVVFDSTFPSSFGMKLVAWLPPDLAGESLVAVAVRDLIEIMVMSDEQLPEYLQQTHNRVAVTYKRLLASLMENEAGVSVMWQRPGSRDVSGARMTYQQVVHAYNIVSAVKDEEATTIKVVGQLTSASTTRHTFEIFMPDGKTRYAGKVLPTAKAEIGTATLNLTYEAVLYVNIEVETATGHIKTHYDLVSLKAV